MKKLLIGIAVAAILALNYAAFDDITTGSEPDKTLEWAIVIGSIVLFITFIVKSGDILCKRKPLIYKI